MMSRAWFLDRMVGPMHDWVSAMPGNPAVVAQRLCLFHIHDTGLQKA